MATFAGKNLTSLKGINLRMDSNLQPGVIRWDLPTNDVSSVSGEYLLYVNSSGALVYDNGVSQTTLGAAGSVTNTWEGIFAADATFTITPDTTFTIAGNRATATDVVTITNVAGGSGDCLQITNSGSGNDISGTSATWKVTKAGAATFVGLTPGGDITSTATAIDWDLADNNSSALSFDAGGAAGLLNFDTSNGAEIVSSAATSFLLSGGLMDVVQASNTVASLRVTNNTATTFGADANSSGVAVFRSTSLTTGSLLQLQLTEGTLNGGFYLTCRDVTAGANVMTLGEDGAVAIAGAGGNNMLAITAGDVVLSDGSVTVTDADDAASLSVTNNTATTASVVVVAGSGTFTGSTTTSFMTVTPSGLTSGTGVYLPLAALTTGKGLHITSGATQTSGSLLYVQDTGANAAITSGTAATFDLTATAITGTVNKTGAGVAVTSSRTTTSGTVSDDFDLLSVVRTDIINGAGSMTAAGSAMYLEVAVTNTSGTVTSTVNGLEIVMDSLGTGDGINVTHSAITGKALNVTSSATTAAGVVLVTANSLTSGQMLKLASSATAIATTGRMFLSSHSGTTGTSAVLNEFISAATDETVVLQAKASAALAAGKIVHISGASVTTGTLLDISDNTAHTTGKAVNIVTNSSDTGTRSLVYIKQDHASASGATPLEVANDGALPAIKVTAAATSLHFYPMAVANGVTIWISDGTTANGALSGTAGDICLNAGSNKPEYCTGTTNWTALV